MKKFTYILLSLLAGAPALAAETAVNDTTITYQDKSIVLQDSVGKIKIKVFDASQENQTKPYKQVYEGIYTDDKSYEKWTVMEELSFQLPFLKKRKRDDHKMKAHWSGLGFGLSNVTNEFLNLNPIDGFPLKTTSSKEFFFNFSDHIIPLIGNNLGLTTGMGFDWRNYYFDDNVHLVETMGITKTEVTPLVTYKYSRLRTVYFTVPLLLEFQPSFGNRHKDFIAFGVVGGVRTSAASKVRYKDLDGDWIKKYEGRDMNVAPFCLDYVFMAGMGHGSLYAKYSPNSIFESGKGPRVQAISAGFVWGL